jgi:2,6-dihydroxypseudooxynicotine hydrolase
MASDPNVNLIFSLFIPRYSATGVDINDLNRLVARIDQWKDWCRIWSEEALVHERLAEEAAEKGRKVTAGEAWRRASIMYHYGKHMFGANPEEFQVAHEAMLRCYKAAFAAGGDIIPGEHITIPYQGKAIHCWLRKPHGIKNPPVAIILPGLDACKEELHDWSDAYLQRGMATIQLDGPGQGESIALPITPEWGKVAAAVIDMLEKRSDVDATRVGVVGQSLGAIYAPLVASLEPRIKACVANCGPFNFGPVVPQMPELSQELFRIRSHLKTRKESEEFAYQLNLEKAAPQMKCPLLILFGAGDKIIPPSEGQLLADAVGGKVDYVVYPEGNHVCFNIPYKFRPLTADWMIEHL